MKTKVVVYGIGDNFSRNYNWIKDNYEIVALADGSPKKWGMQVQAWKVCNIQEIEKSSYEKILVTPNIYHEIKKSLLEIGLSQDKIISLLEEMKSDVVGKELNICFQIDGGMGDQIVALNYIQAFYVRFGTENVKIKVYCRRNGTLMQSIVGHQQAFEIYDEKVEDLQEDTFDCVIYIRRYPEVKKADMNKISRHVPELVDYIFLCEKFKIFHPRFFTEEFVADGESAMLENISKRKRIQQPDVYGELEITEKYIIPIDADIEVLQKHQLRQNAYITIHHGYEYKNFGKQSVKLWDTESYNGLITYIKEQYSDMPVVILGAEHEADQGLQADLDLAGKLSIEETKSILKYSLLHIDVEGGLVHLRQALNGGSSIVLFGPTSDEFFGYTSNINIRTKACPYPCEWTTCNWSKHCLNENEPFICMKSITPDMVMQHITKYIESRKSE